MPITTWAGLAAAWRRYWPLALGAALAGLVVVRTVQAGIRLPKPPTEQLAYDVSAGLLLPGATIGQTFVARNGRVVRVDIRLGAEDQRPASPLIFHLKRSPQAAADLATVAIDAVTVQGGAFYSFEFAPAPNRIGEPLYFYLEAPEATAGNALSVWGSAQDVYPGGQAVLTPGRAPPPPDLAFRVHYAPTLRQYLASALAQVTANKPGLFGSPAWYVGLGLLYLTMLVWLGWLVGTRGAQGAA